MARQLGCSRSNWPAELANPADARTAANLIDDQSFLRRVSQDLLGELPTPEEVTAFVLDPSADKRGRLVEGLLADPRFGRNWGRYFRDVILYRRTDDRSLIAQFEPRDFSRRAIQSRGWLGPHCPSLHHGPGRCPRARRNGPDDGTNGAGGRDRRRDGPHFPGRANPMRPVPRSSDRPLETRAISRIGGIFSAPGGAPRTRW